MWTTSSSTQMWTTSSSTLLRNHALAYPWSDCLNGKVVFTRSRALSKLLQEHINTHVRTNSGTSTHCHFPTYVLMDSALNGLQYSVLVQATFAHAYVYSKVWSRIELVTRVYSDTNSP